MALSMEAWWSEQGPFTRAFLILTLVLSGLVVSGAVSPWLLVADGWKMIVHLQLWRFVTAAVFMGKFSFSWIMAVATFTIFLKNHEQIGFAGRPADLAWMLLILTIGHHVLGLLSGSLILAHGLLMSLVWVWCKRNPNSQLTIYMFAFKGSIFPFALMGFHVLLGGGVVDDVVGIIVGHLYVFAVDILPKSHNVELLPVPAPLLRLLPPSQKMGTVNSGAWTGGTRAAAGVPQPAMGAHRWGAGRPLGMQ